MLTHWTLQSTCVRNPIIDLLLVKTALIRKRTLVPIDPGDVDSALAIARAAVKGGAKLLEVYYRKSNAPDDPEVADQRNADLIDPEEANQVVRALREEFEGKSVFVGAGSIGSPEFAAHAIKSGAQFLVSKGFSREVLTVAAAFQVLYIPGTFTPTEIDAARNALMTAYGRIWVSNEELASDKTLSEAGVTPEIRDMVLLKFFCAVDNISYYANVLGTYSGMNLGMVIAGGVYLNTSDRPLEGKDPRAEFGAVKNWPLVVAVTASALKTGTPEEVENINRAAIAKLT